MLGSMPGEDSLKQNEYYAHPRNLFWSLMSQVLGFSPELGYQHRTEQLIKNHIALWDVIKSCEREGSLDSSIINTSIKINNFRWLFKAYPTIQYVCFNGKKAEAEFKKHVLKKLTMELEFITLPSTSPANAGITQAEKSRKWSVLKKLKQVSAEDKCPPPFSG